MPLYISPADNVYLTKPLPLYKNIFIIFNKINLTANIFAAINDTAKM